MIKKLTALILIIPVIMISAVCVNAAVSKEYIPDFLNALSIPAEKNVPDDMIMTRGEFAILAAKLTNTEGHIYTAENTAFADIPKGHKAYESVHTLYQMGIIHGAKDMPCFYPDDGILMKDAAKILVLIMGYGHLVSDSNYIPAAARKKIIAGIKTGANDILTYNDALNMLTNTLDADVSDYNLYNPVEKRGKAITYAEQRLSVYTVNGVLSDNGNASLNGETEITKGHVIIGGTGFKDAAGVQELLGHYIKGYYKYDSQLDVNILIFAYASEQRNNILTVNADMLCSYSGYRYEYYMNADKEKTLKVSLQKNFKLIYNGKFYESYKAEAGFSLSIEEMLLPKTGNVTLIDSENDGIFETVIVKSYVNYVVSAIDSKTYTIYGKPEITQGSVSLKSAEDDLVVKNNMGTFVDFSSIRLGSVASVGKSADGKYAEIIVSGLSETGIIQESDNEGILINENYIEFSFEYLEYTDKKITENKPVFQMGGRYKAYMTFEKKVIFMEAVDDSGWIFSYLDGINSSKDITKGVTMRLYTENNEVVIYRAAEKVNVDGMRYSDTALLNYLDVYTKDGIYGGIIRIRLNNQGLVHYIDTPYDAALGNPNSATETDDSLHILEGGNLQTLRYISSIKAFGGSFLGNSDSLCFISVSEESDALKHMAVTNLLSDPVKTETGYKVTAFATKKDAMFAEVILYTRGRYGIDVNGINNTTSQYVVLKVADSADMNGETIKKITVTDGRIMRDFYTESRNSLKCTCNSGPCAAHPIEASKGDIVRFGLNKYGTISDGNIFVMYDYSENKHWSYFREYTHIETKTISGSFHFGTPLISGYINKLSDQAIEVICSYWPFEESMEVNGSYEMSGKAGENIKKVFTLERAYVMSVNPGNGTMKLLTTSDLKPYNDGNGFKKDVYMLFTNGAPMCIVMYDE